MKTALVLGGGGSKGAYEIGVWKALRELEVPIHIVCGTSIGAMIGVMVVQNQFEKVYQEWTKISVDDVIAGGIDLEYNWSNLWKQKERYRPFLNTFLTQKGCDITPFHDLIERMMDEQRFFASEIDFACMSVNVSRKKPHVFYKKQMVDKEDLQHALLATSACFPAFPMHTIDQEQFIDGGYYDNVPIDLAHSMGAEQIICVDLKSAGKKKTKKQQANVIYIEPYVSLGSFLSFDHERIMRNIQLGYYDCMKKMKQYVGYMYAFQCQDKQLIRAFEKKAKQYCRKFSLPMDDSISNKIYHSIIKSSMITSLSQYASYNYPYLRVLELGAYLFEINELHVYSFSTFIAKITEVLYHYKPTYQDFKWKEMKPQKLNEIIHKISMKDLIYYIYSNLQQQDETELKKLFKIFAIVCKESFMIAVMLHVANTYKEEWMESKQFI